MKKNLFFATGGAILTVAVSVFLYVNGVQNTDDEVFNANVEALAEQETGGGKCGAPAAYEYDTNDIFMDKKNFMRCGDCSWIQGGQPVYTIC